MIHCYSSSSIRHGKLDLGPITTVKLTYTWYINLKKKSFLISFHHWHQILMYSFFKFCSLEPTCQRPNKPLRRFSQNKDCCTKRICQPWCCVSQRYFHSSQSHWRNWSACSVKRRRPWSSRNNNSSSMGRKTSSVIIPNPRGISVVVI